jgi:hypothetical protein
MGVETFRLRPGKDDDIREALTKAIEEQKLDRSVLIRAALRAFLLQSHNFIFQRPENRQIELSAEDDMGVFELERKEKDPKQLEGDLDSLLSGF